MEEEKETPKEERQEKGAEAQEDSPKKSALEQLKEVLAQAEEKEKAQEVHPEAAEQEVVEQTESKTIETPEASDASPDAPEESPQDLQGDIEEQETGGGIPKSKIEEAFAVINQREEEFFTEEEASPLLQQILDSVEECAPSETSADEGEEKASLFDSESIRKLNQVIEEYKAKKATS